MKKLAIIAFVALAACSNPTAPSITPKADNITTVESTPVTADPVNTPANVHIQFCLENS